MSDSNILTAQTAAKADVLVVDDDPIFTTIAEVRLSNAGYRVRAVNDGVSALELLDSECFDAALIDLTMPRIDGFRLIGLIRGAPRLRRLGLMVVTSRLDQAAWDDALALGAHAVETKPVDWSVVAPRILKIIEEAQRLPRPNLRIA